MSGISRKVLAERLRYRTTPELQVDFVRRVLELDMPAKLTVKIIMEFFKAIMGGKAK